MQRIAFVNGLLAALVVLSAACSSSAGPTGSLVYPRSIEPSDGVPAPTALVLHLHLPLDDYLLSVDEIYTIEAATDILVQACMSKRGLGWRLIDRPQFGDWRNRRRYGVIEPLVAQRFGYHAVPALLSPVQVYNKKVERYRSLSHQQLVAAVDPRTGCEKKGITALRKKAAPLHDSQASSLQAQSLYDSQRQPAVRQALVQWSACMMQAGYHYADPLTASADRRWSQTKSADESEIATAVADVQCKSKTTLVEIWFQNEVIMQMQLIEQHRPYLNSLQNDKTHLLSAAAAIIQDKHS